MESIAIIGIGCRFPGANNPEAFWQLLSNSVDAIAEIPKERWNIDEFYDPEPGKPGKMSTRWGGFLDQVDQFDPAFFGISPREVERMDPQQRLVLEVAWEAIENAGLAADQLSGSLTGVFMGIGNYDYCRLLASDLNQISAYDGTGNTLSIAANRLSYILNLRGPSAVVETACSSSLVALHFACRSLQSGESNLCLVGGASLMLSPGPFITYSHARMMASDGRCKTFDASADGYVRGEGCGVVVLKRLSDALKDGDNILAVVRGTAVNQDGLSNGLTAPNGPSQQAVIRQALKNAGVSPAQISYVETHGTGTSLGDPIEFKSLKAVLMPDRQPDQPCWLGSLKTNIGHLEAASGIASVIKVVLSLQHQTIPAHLHLKTLNPYISLDETTFSIPVEAQPWLSGAAERLAGVSAFGFGGTNCHVILGEAPRIEPDSAKVVGELERLFHVLTLSAKNEPALTQLAQRYQGFLATHPEVSLADVCFTANTGRSHFDHRLAVVASSNQQLREQLEAFAASKETAGLVSHQSNGKKAPKIAFLFTGQGSQYVGMGRQLYDTQPIFRQTLDRCAKLLRPYLDKPLLEVFGSDLLNETVYTQPALFALEYALAQVWLSWGIKPAVVMGHSVGEYVAACLAGVFSLEDGLKLIAERARLMQELPPDGAMVAVFASEAMVSQVIKPYLEVAIAAINGPQSIVISGEREAIAAVVATLQAEGIKTKPLTVSHAFHSPLMEPMLKAFERVARTVTYSSPRIKLISNVTGAIATDEITTPEYWCRHVRQAVRFAQSMETLHQQKYDVFVEVGPKPILLGMGRYCIPESAGIWLPTLYPERDDWQQMLQSLATLYVQGATVDWSRFDQGYSRHRLQLPTYPFQRQRYWAQITPRTTLESTTAPQKAVKTPILDLLSEGNAQQLLQHLKTTENLSGEELNVLPKLLELLVKQHQHQIITESIKDWFYEIEWQIKSRQLVDEPKNGFHKPGTWLVFADFDGVGEALAHHLQEQGKQCVLVYPGPLYRVKDTGAWVINPSNSDDFDRLFQDAIASCDRLLQGIIHLWSLEARPTDELTLPALEQAQGLGVISILHLLQTLGKMPLHTTSNQNGGHASPRLWLVTRNAVSAGSAVPAVAQAPLWGLGKVIALEHPDWWGGMVDLAPVATEDEVLTLLVEIENPQGEDHLAFRDGQRYVARLVQKQPSQIKPISFQPDNTYLITGGLGALGLKVAQWIINEGARHLVLIGRRDSSEARQALDQLEQRGAKVLVVQADVADEADMLKAFESIDNSLPPLKGIIHAAGVSRYEAIAATDASTFATVLRPKVAGTWLLHELTQNMQLDFFVSFSSISAVWGSKGQGHYAAANYFLDALAQYRHQLELPALSVNWGPWAGGGMALEEFQVWLTRMGVEGLQPEQALAALKYLLGTDSVQTTVANVNWTVFKDLFEARGKRSLLEQLGAKPEKAIEPTAEPTSEQRSPILQQLESVPESDRYTILLAHLQSEAAKVLRLAQLPDPQQGLFDLGMDSLMAVELVGLIRSQLQVELPISDFMQASSIAALAAVLMKQLAPNTIVTSEVTVNVLDLNHEANLDSSIYPVTPAEEYTEAASIFLTGATGFLGAFLLDELLRQTQATIYCLVRASDPNVGLKKIQTNLTAYQRWHDHYRSRIIPIIGDLSQPQLGISTEQFETLARQIDVIYHNAATLNFVYPYSALKSTNVLGTQEVLRLACLIKTKPLHYVSTDAVFDSSAYYGIEVIEAEPILHTEGIDLGYTQTKWVSEKLVTIARDRGLPVTIYRPPLIAGDSKTGTWNTDDFTCRFLKGCIQMGSMPDMNCGITLVPVDYVSQAVVYLSRQKQAIGKAFHLNNPNFSTWSEVAGYINDYGYSVQQISYEEWENKLIDIVSSQDNALSGLLPFFLRRWSDEQLTFAGLGQRRVKLNCQATVAQLSGSSIACPRVDTKLLNTYFSYFIQSGFLEAPKVRA
ncbi:thioester reductase domain-containing protein [Oscillatoria sp. FACHB-1407]|uniref:type I polyketide synthase n=1 Tax=Oscillatoria sp. FACHB-1407 TaxID=2692847 RepID=UPI0016822487|nr:type I polyketide synthase [Oscillatoria sp. FACHB-1407]MBD2464423.1 thioester reductase domain-containing protein [Oscillatoria sp. FACHB-1407]